jgi:hypothetical protein
MSDAPLHAFPDVVDNTLISAFRRCETSAYYSGIRRIRAHENSTHLIAGGAFARGLEVTRKRFFEEGETFSQAFEAGVIALVTEYGDHVVHPKIAQKGVWNMVAALDYYFRVWPIDRGLVPFKLANGKHAIEFSFCLPTSIMHPITGDPIMYAGKFDMIGVHDNNQLFVTDEKTSTQLGDYWLQRWRMSNQMTGYVWAARMHGIPVKGAWIRGIGILARSLTSANVPTLRPQWRIDDWYAQLQLTLHKMVTAWQSGAYQKNLDAACSAYGGCTYMNLCEVQNPEEWIPINYHANTWSPLNSRD